MRNILIYRHPDCAKCLRIVRTHRLLDILGRVEDSTNTPPTGPLQLGEILVQDGETGAIKGGVEAFRLIVRSIPFYAPAHLLLMLPWFRSYIEREMGGCAGGSCMI